MCLCNSSILWLIIHHRPLFLDFKIYSFYVSWLWRGPYTAALVPLCASCFFHFGTNSIFLLFKIFITRHLSVSLECCCMCFWIQLLYQFWGVSLVFFNFFFKLIYLSILFLCLHRIKNLSFYDTSLTSVSWLTSLLLRFKSTSPKKYPQKLCWILCIFFLSVFLLTHGFLSEDPPLSSLLFWMLLLVT